MSHEKVTGIHKIAEILRDLFFALLVVCENLSLFMLLCTMCTSLFVITTALNVPRWLELYKILRFKYLRWQNVIKILSTKLAIECSASSKAWYQDGLRAEKKTRTHNNRRNNNFVIFQRSRLKLIKNLFENLIIN